MVLLKRQVIGLTGGIGCGKTTATQHFAALGARIIDTDHLSHALSVPPSPALTAIKEAFGADFINAKGELNRALMRQLVFNDPAAKIRLEAIFHPLIMQSVAHELAKPSNAPYSLLVVPLLFDHPNFLALCHSTVAIDCTEQKQIERVALRSKLTHDEIIAIIATQTPRNIRLAKSNYVLTNNNTIAHLNAQIINIHHSLLNISAHLEQ